MLWKRISFILLVIAITLVFKKFFLPGPLVFGDTPYFYKEGLRELVNFPSAWTARGVTFGGVNLFLWIYPLMVFYGALGFFLHLNNDLILRLLFYFPSLVFGFIGIYLLTKTLKLSKTVTFFAALLYLVNTYFILLVDGGQVGVVLAYGLFPLVLNFLIRDSYLPALGAVFLLSIVDFRIAAICIFTAILLKLVLRKNLKILFFLSISLIGLSLYWIIPALKLSNGVSIGISGLQTTSLLNSLSLFSPNWPANEFGVTSAPYFYFMLIPVLVFLPIFITRERKIAWITFCFLIFAFLSKGESGPVGFLYTFFINNKVGSVFRDSTKFFIPLTLIAGILIGVTVEKINKKLFGVFVFVYILFLVVPVFTGKLNGVLGKNPNLSDYQKIYNLFLRDTGTFRDAWFNEKSPFAYHTEQKQALDAKDLVNYRPFASMNAGTGDHFNFINNKSYLDWFGLLGIKYLVFNGSPRTSQLNKSDLDDWNRLTSLIANDNRLKKSDIGTNFPVYQNPNILPNKFFVEKSFVILGGDDMYQKFSDLNKNFSVTNQGFIFPEDGKFDPTSLQNVASTSAVIIFNNESQVDLKMSFLQKNFVFAKSAYYSQWALRNSGEYLSYKYELLQNNIDFHDFDYSQGIAFSSQTNEELKYSMKVLTDGDYYLEVRSMNASGSSDIKVNFNKTDDLIERKSANNFEWYEKGPITLHSGNYSLNLQNMGGTQVINTVALVTSADMKIASQLTDNYLGTFPSYDLNKTSDQLKLKQILQRDKWENLVDGQVTKPGWIIFTDSYNENWELQKVNENNSGYPMYSMVNGFYVHPDWGEISIIFKGDEYLRWGIYFSVLSLLIIVIAIIWRESKK